ncbi:hypothetical protein GCM10020216_076600 [Nonomuraea helvata]
MHVTPVCPQPDARYVLCRNGAGAGGGKGGWSAAQGGGVLRGGPMLARLVRWVLRVSRTAAKQDPGSAFAAERMGVLADSSFDIVSKIDRQEVDNALNQTVKEIGHRFDFKGTGAAISWSGQDNIEIKANSEERAGAALDVFKEKVVKRGLSLKILDAGEPKLSGKEYRMMVSLKEGIDQENAKKISKLIRDEGPKGIKAQIQGEELRVSSKKKDDLQEVISLLKGKDLDIALQFVNYR